MAIIQMEAGKLELPTNNLVSDGQKILVGIRPEVLVPSDAGLNVAVAVVEPTGAETHLVTRSDGQEFMSVLRERSTLKIGQRINLAAPKTSLHIFDAESGNRLEGRS